MELKERLHRILLKNPKDITEVAKDMDVGYIILRNFIMEENKGIRFKSKIKIEAWVQQKEKELGMTLE